VWQVEEAPAAAEEEDVSVDELKVLGKK